MLRVPEAYCGTQERGNSPHIKTQPVCVVPDGLYEYCPIQMRTCMMGIQKQAQRTHHIASHFTNGLFPAASACITLFLLTGDTLFENASLCCCAIGAVGAPIVYGSGLLDWRVRFRRRSARVFARKRLVGALLVLAAVLLVASRLSLGGEITTAGAVKYIYAGAIYLVTGMATYLGHLGGKFIV